MEKERHREAETQHGSSENWKQFGKTTCALMQAGLDFYEAQMVGTLPTTLSNDVSSYRGNAFVYEATTPQLGFTDLSGGWCTGDEVGKLLSV